MFFVFHVFRVVFKTAWYLHHFLSTNTGTVMRNNKPSSPSCWTENQWPPPHDATLQTARWHKEYASGSCRCRSPVEIILTKTTTAFYQNRIGVQLVQQKGENKRGECQSDGIGWRIVVSWHQLHQGFDIELVTLEDRCRN